jgi:hypothetical protein
VETWIGVAKSEGALFLSVFEQLAADAAWMSEVRAGDGAHPGVAGSVKLAALVEVWPDWWFR